MESLKASRNENKNHVQGLIKIKNVFSKLTSWASGLSMFAEVEYTMGKITASLKPLELHEQLQAYFSWTRPESPGWMVIQLCFSGKKKKCGGGDG